MEIDINKYLTEEDKRRIIISEYRKLVQVYIIDNNSKIEKMIDSLIDEEVVRETKRDIKELTTRLLLGYIDDL